MRTNGKSQFAILIVILSLAVVVGAVVSTILILNSRKNMPRPDIHQIGGAIVVYEIDDAGLADQERGDLPARMIRALRKRFDPAQIRNLTWLIRDDTHIEIHIPGAAADVLGKKQDYLDACEALRMEGIDPVEAMLALDGDRGDLESLTGGSQKGATLVNQFASAYESYRPHMDVICDHESLHETLTRNGMLEFRVLVTQGHPDVDMEVVAECLASLEENGPAATPDAKYVWCEVSKINDWTTSDPSGDTRQIVTTDGERRPVVWGQSGQAYYVLASNEPNEVMLSDSGQTNWRVKTAQAAIDQVGRPAISFSLDRDGSRLFGQLTGGNIDRPLCILLNGQAVSAPLVHEPISGGVMITGSFTHQETERFARLLCEGPLPAPLKEEPVSVTLVTPAPVIVD